MIFLQPNWLIGFVCAFVFYGAAEMEAPAGRRGNAILWAGLSIALSALVIHVFGSGWFLVLVAQAVLFVGIGVVRALRESKSSVKSGDD